VGRERLGLEVERDRPDADPLRRAVVSSVSPCSSESPRIFFATSTAAGIATPTAAPATTFFEVDMPSCSGSMRFLRFDRRSSAPAFAGVVGFSGS
jgi:hypothetical protein